MDRLRKRLERVQVKVRKWLKYNWHNEPEGDQFRSLDILYVVGAVRYKPTKTWQRICWNAYYAVPFFSILMLSLNAADEIPGKFNLTKVTWHVSTHVVAILCLVKCFILSRNFVSIQIVQNFVNSKPFASGDSMFQIANDAECRKRCFQRLQFTILVIFITLLLNVTVCIVPIFGIDEFLATPRVVQSLGARIAAGLHFLFLVTACPLWLSKFTAGTGTVCSLLHGLNNEYEIFVRGFDKILDIVYSDVEEEFPSTVKATPDWRRFHRDQLYWKYLKQRLNDQVKLHVQFVENLQLLEPVVKFLFGSIYYNAMICFSPIIYVLVTSSLSGSLILLASTVAIHLLDCYIWCRIVDSLKDTNAKMELKILDLATKIPYSEFHRKKYAEMQTTLCIMKIFVRNHEPFTCFGVFPINVEAFTELLHIGYTVFTFLRDMGKKDVNVRRRMKQRKPK